MRQVRRLVARHRDLGAAGLASGHRGKRSNNAIGGAVRREVMDLVRERYGDFGPTFAREKLVEHPRASAVGGDVAQVDDRGRAVAGEGAPGAAVASEPSAAGVRWGSGADRRLAARLVRGAGSGVHADRVRGRRDDAAAGDGGFFAEETTEAHMRTTRAHLEAHGRPVAYYSDRYSVFRVNRKGGEDRPTQFTRALRTLDIAAIHAHSPQAKGRVERANRTLQDRLVKEMRLRGIGGMAAGNAYLPEFMADFNRRFAVAPRNARGRAPEGAARRRGSWI